MQMEINSTKCKALSPWLVVPAYSCAGNSGGRNHCRIELTRQSMGVLMLQCYVPSQWVVVPHFADCMR